MSKQELFDAMLPVDLKPSLAKLALVAGAPGAGKSTFVKAVSRPGDLIIDADIEAQKLGLSRYTSDPLQVREILQARNERLRELSTTTAERAWFIFSGAKVSTRWHFIKRLRPVRCYVVIAGLKSPLIECVNRISETRPDAGAGMIEAARRWHKNYEPHPNDKVVISKRENSNV